MQGANNKQVLCSNIKRRPYSTCKFNFRSLGMLQAFYGVYDGHGGRAAVDLVADKLGKNVVAALAAASRRESGVPSSSRAPAGGDEDETERVVAAIRAAYLTTDSEFLSQVSISRRILS